MFEQCRGFTSQSRRCRRDSSLNAQGYCVLHRDQAFSSNVDNSQNTLHRHESSSIGGNFGFGIRCRGTTKSGAQCRITWDLDVNKLCKYHKYQQPRKLASRCSSRGFSEDGTHRQNSADLELTSQLCTSRNRHNPSHSSVSHRQPDDGAQLMSSPAKSQPDTSASVTQRVHVDHIKTGITPDTNATAATTPQSNAINDKSTDSAHSPTGTQVSNAAGSRDDSPSIDKSIPPWTAEYNVSTGLIVVRMYSEWSWRCYHDPIVVKVPWWSKVDSTAAKVVAGLCKLIPYVGGTLSPALHTQFDATEFVMGILEQLQIEEGGFYSSECGEEYSDEKILENLLESQIDKFKRKQGISVSRLGPVTHSTPVWVSKKSMLAIEKVTRQPRPTADVMLQFLRIEGKFWDHHSRFTIHWQLLKGPSEDPIEKGVACVGEQVEVMNVSRDDLAQCVLAIELKRKWLTRELVGCGNIPLEAEALFGAPKQIKLENVKRVKLKSWCVHVRFLKERDM